MPTSSSTPFAFSSPQQRQLHERLIHFISPGSAALYQDAQRLLAEPTPYASTTHIVFHLLREIESAVRYVLLPYDYHASAQRSSGASTQTSPETSADDTQPEKEEQHKHQIEAIATLYHLSTSLMKTWIDLAVGSRTNPGFAELAHREALAMPRPVDAAFYQAIQQFEAVLDQVMEAFENQSFHVFHLLDRLLTKQQPGRRDASHFMNRIPPNRVTYSYFFTRLENPVWLALLQDKGVFSPPPTDVQEGRMYYDLWPQADYLKKVVVNESAQEQVLSLLLAAAQTENPFVQQAILEIAACLPAVRAIQLAPSIKRWFDKPDPHASVTSLLEAFLEHLVEGGEASIAIELFDISLTASENRDSLSARWEYEQLLRCSLSLLSTSHSQALLHLLCHLLDRAIYQQFVRFRTPDEVDTTVPQQARKASTIGWQGTIEATGRPTAQGLNAPLHLLVSTTRQAAEQAIEAQALTLSDTISLLETHSGRIFRRLALYLLSRFASHDPVLVRTWLLRQSLFDDVDLTHEYLLLAKEGLSILSSEEQDTLFQWIEEGPDPERFERYSRHVYQETPTEEQVQQHKVYWQWRWLGQVGDALPMKWHPYYDALIRMFGPYEPEPSEASRSLRDWSFDRSLEAYKTMPIEQILEEIHTSEDRQSPVLVLTTLIAEQPTRFADQAGRFQGEPPEVVAATLKGFVEAVQQGRHAYDWTHIIALCAWTVEQRAPLAAEERGSQANRPAWSEASKEVAILLLSAFQQPMIPLSLAWREAIWSMLESLAEDDYSLVRETSRREPRPYWYLVINSTRGLALLAITEYARWLHQNWQREPALQERARKAWTFEQAPDVQALLERFLHPASDTNGVAHAVFGHAFPLLFHLDARWTTQHLSVIFPHEVADSFLFDAAWESYVSRRPLSSEAFALLRSEYAFAIERLHHDDEQPLSPDTPESSLATHLSLLVIRGETSTNSPDNLLIQFFQHASDELRHRMVSDIGRILTNDREHVLPQMVERCQLFWEWRIAAITSSPQPHRSRREAAAFGWWADSALFPARWTVQHLERVLALTETIDMSSRIVHRLAMLVSVEPELTVQCLKRLVQGDTRSWGGTEWNKEVTTILSEALQQQDEEIQTQAKALISVLMMQGHTQYRALFPDV